VSVARLGEVSFWLLLALQPTWYLWLAPPTSIPPALAAGLAILLLLPPAIGLLLRRPNALFWGGLVSLLYFCHGVTELWSNPGVRLLAGAETGLATALVLAIGWDGLQRRRAARASQA